MKTGLEVNLITFGKDVIVGSALKGKTTLPIIVLSLVPQER